jgi:hypothetical protein
MVIQEDRELADKATRAEIPLQPFPATLDLAAAAVHLPLEAIPTLIAAQVLETEGTALRILLPAHPLLVAVVAVAAGIPIFHFLPAREDQVAVAMVAL